MNLEETIFSNAIKLSQKHVKKQSLLLDLGQISNLAKDNKLKNVQKGFQKADTIALAYSLLTNNRFFEESLTETYMDAYGSSEMNEKVPTLNLEISNKSVLKEPDMLGLMGLTKGDITKSIPKSDFYFVSEKHHARKLTNHDVYLSLHHALLSLVYDSPKTLDDLSNILGKIKGNNK